MVDKIVLVSCILLLSFLQLAVGDETISYIPHTQRFFNEDHARRDSYPFMARLVGKIPKYRFLSIFPTSFSYRWCCATIIHSRWVLSVAHCVFPAESTYYQRQSKFWKVQVGHSQLYNEEDYDFDSRDNSSTSNHFPFRKYQLKQIYVQGFYVHPDYNFNGTFLNDIILVKLRKNIPVRTHPYAMDKILMPNQFDRLPGSQQTCRFIGWQCLTNRDDGPHGTFLPEVTLRAVDVSDICRTSCPKEFGGHYRSTKVCSKRFQKGPANCSGDEGCPIYCRVVRNGIRMYQLAGLLSFSSSRCNASGGGGRVGDSDVGGGGGGGSGDQNTVAITRISPYIEWIREIVERDQCSY